MRTTLLTTAFALLTPAALFAAPMRAVTHTSGVATHASAMHAVATAAVTAIDDPDCGRGRAWGCRRDRDDRYDDRRERWERERWERERYERARWERERYTRELRARARYERERDREYTRHRRYARYDGYPVACIRAGGHVLGSAVLTICVP